MSISFTMLWVSIAKTVGPARRSTTAYGEPVVASGTPVEAGMVAIA